MKHAPFMQVIILLLVCAMGLSSAAAAQEDVAKNALLLLPVTEQVGDNYVIYPTATGMDDALAQINLNLLLMERGEVNQSLDSLARQTALSWGIQADYTAFVKEDLLSVTYCLNGDLGHNQSEQKYLTFNYDSQLKREIELEDLLIDVEKATEHMEKVVEESVTPHLSGYAAHEEVFPLPLSHFAFNSEAVTFYYDNTQYVTLSGIAGCISFYYYELEAYLDVSPGSVLERLGVSQSLALNETLKEQVAEEAARGVLGSIPFAIGDSLEDIFASFRKLTGPDYYPDNRRYYRMEDGYMRDIQLLSDDGETLSGIRADRLNLYGIKVGVTRLDQWRELLGMPPTTVSLDAYTMQDYALLPGTGDYYTFGEFQLRFFADEDNVLQSIQLMR